MKQARPVPVPSGRLTRMSRIGLLAAGVAGNMAASGLRQISAGTRPSSRELLLTPRNITRIADELARMRGAAMKVGQLLSMDTGDVLPPELADIMARLRAEADFMPPKQLKQVLTAELSADWLSHFKQFDPRPIAAASIGQVHRAVLKDGRQIALKVQYPGVAESIDSDVANVGRLVKLSGMMPAGFDLGPYLDEARKQLREEADYAQEAAYLGQFRALMGGDANFALPETLPELSSDRVLAMTFVDGGPIEAVAEAAQEERDRVMTIMIELMFRELFNFRLMQTDPNFANYLYSPSDGTVALLDFGATRELSAPIVDAYARLMRAGVTGDGDAALTGPSETLGLVTPDLDPRYREVIFNMMRLVFETVLQTEVFDFGATDLLARLQTMGETLAKDRVILPPPPMDVLYIQRKFAGMFLLAGRLRARVPVRQILSDAIEI